MFARRLRRVRICLPAPPLSPPFPHPTLQPSKSLRIFGHLLRCLWTEIRACCGDGVDSRIDLCRGCLAGRFSLFWDGTGNLSGNYNREFCDSDVGRGLIPNQLRSSLKSSLIPKEQAKRSRETSAVLIGQGAQPQSLMSPLQPILKRCRDPNPSPLHPAQLDLKEIHLIGRAVLVPEPTAFLTH